MTPVTLRADFDAAKLRALAKVSKSAGATRRLFALAEVYDGGSRTDAARIGGVGLQTIRDGYCASMRADRTGSSTARPRGRRRSSQTPIAAR